MTNSTPFSDYNLAYLYDLYDRYLANPASVDAATRAYFETWTPSSEGAMAVPPAPTPVVTLTPTPLPAVAPRGEGSQTPQRATDRGLAKNEERSAQTLVGFVRLAQNIRAFGHLAARLDPLGADRPGDPVLTPEYYGLSEETLRALDDDIIGGPVTHEARNAREAIQALRHVYTETTGHEYLQIRVPEEREWLQEVVETERFTPPNAPLDEVGLLRRLTQVEVFERFLHRTFPGKTRFSIEGLDMMIPMLDEMIGGSADVGTRYVLLGMAHRGRMNVLAHILGKSYAGILAEFLDKVQNPTAGNDSSDEGWSGDVKYHLGGVYTPPELRKVEEAGRLVDMKVKLAANPSHLEFVNPVVVGMGRAAETRRDLPGAPIVQPNRALPILIHGDAAFMGQGVVAETLNLHRLSGYTTGGTIHIIANNQIGFTTPSRAARSSTYASDLAKGFRIPIVHVNADDPIACIAVARLAHAYRTRFHKDFVIDLVGYRRWGHNEGDEPSFTQPKMYDKIATHPTVRTQWAEYLVQRGVIKAEDAEAMVQAEMDALRKVYDEVQAKPYVASEVAEVIAAPRRQGHIETAVAAERLATFNADISHLPDNFTLNPKLKRVMDRRRNAFDPPVPPNSGGEGGQGGIDWGHAEALAFATILAEGTPIRMTGQDVGRGTFSQRHAVLHDYETGGIHIPLQHLRDSRASFEIHDSPLSENAVLGFEYGYTLHAGEVLVLWEAQYGDFINGAQVIIDQFIASAKVKWADQSGMVLLLPHGYEGQGPEHSSARLERFLELAAENNLRIANCTTAAQYFHLLRRQAALLRADPRPLIVMTPKSLLRHPLAASPVAAFAQGAFQPVIDDDVADRDKVERVVLVSGKVYVDLATNKERSSAEHVALVRVEQLYPFPAAEIRGILDRYPNITEVVWLQEEPANMGAWRYMRPRLRELLTGLGELLGRPLAPRYFGRRERASPAEGSAAWHQAEQRRIVEAALAPMTQPQTPEVQHGD